MTKSDLITVLAAECNLSLRTTEEAVDSILNVVTKGLVDGNRIELRGFGIFTPRQYKAYKGRNPRTGIEIHVPPKTLPTFKMGKELCDALKGPQ
jgi:integration host factor subunit beta